MYLHLSKHFWVISEIFYHSGTGGAGVFTTATWDSARVRHKRTLDLEWLAWRFTFPKGVLHVSGGGCRKIHTVPVLQILYSD